MSYANLLRNAATFAQSTLAQMQGMAPDGTNVLLSGGTKCIGVFDFPQPLEQPLPGGGFRKKTIVRLSITRDQLDGPPDPRTKLVRTDIAPGIPYTIDHVDTQQPLVYLLTLINFSD